METNFEVIPGGVCAAKGFSASGVHAGFRANPNKLDLAIIKADVRCAAAGVYTTNKVYGAPIRVDRAHLTDGHAQAILVNSGNANTCAANGVDLANECCALVAEQLGIAKEDVLPASTGVIGQPMTIDPFARGIPQAAALLEASPEGSNRAAKAIMTTDTYEKEYALQFTLDGKTCHLGAIGKGSGMIAPNMATMLAFYTTDAAVSPELLQKALRTVVPTTYNQMSVDLDTSTNDTLLLMASGLAGNTPITAEGPDYEVFLAALTAVAEHMCALHASDGEGATHLITCEVTHAPNHQIARAVAKSVVCSNLFKAAVFGRDANWGRILCAIGYTPGDFSIDHVSVRIASAAGEVFVCENAAYHPFSEEEAYAVLGEHDILVKVDMGTGDAEGKAWGCDLTYDYVKINGDYRT
ncbi:MAG: bifunctional glutamate N-acetyltransferase/amino-acid acetyltransferase ArgJ [Gemmiger sp.]|uniref:bifunctional glutamate N-acetyltransferase/amino-acid acetyltransferase ArgJ n=1 Tax=Gemmiger sp. TaxID=2049027 RepID=UPI002E775DCE|nr:bifunctional glutamate N-acetyltransferase/amino-acid acetyltransferase ArgJ [Gemmiger sp.]MEE0800459.1 bifunctional glutamate N-acetyltransferase/amino-acid acetyltransferase ArgJ [Gemmiger sp.]